METLIIMVLIAETRILGTLRVKRKTRTLKVLLSNLNIEIGQLLVPSMHTTPSSKNQAGWSLVRVSELIMFGVCGS